MLKTVLTASAGALALGLGGCDGGTPAPQASPTAQVVPENPPGIVLSDARIQLPAVSGRPGAAYFTVSQASGAPRSIAGVTVAMVGRTELHETMKSGGASSMKPLKTVPLASGQSVAFEPGGRHVMLFDLDPKLRFEDQTDLTVRFDNGDEARAKARVTTVNDVEAKP